MCLVSLLTRKPTLLRYVFYPVGTVRGQQVETMDALDDEEADDDFSSFGQAAGNKTAAAVSLDDE